MLAAAAGFAPATLARTFTVHATDHVLLLLGPTIDRLLRAEAPGVTLRFLPSVAEDWLPLREGHPRVGATLTLDEYLAHDHLVVAPLGKPSFVDAMLAERGLRRRIRCTVPYFLAGLLLAAAGDDVLTVSARAAHALAPR
ncbi:MAG: hypothetical protein ACK5BN_22340, partial [Planctomycetota bacterium]